MKVVSNTAMRFNKSGELISQTTIKPIEKYNYSQKDYYGSMGWDDSGDYNTSWRSQGAVANESDIRTYPRVAQFDGNTVMETRNSDSRLRFVDENGEIVPTHQLDALFCFVDHEGREMTAIEYLNLEDDEQEYCEVWNRVTGAALEPIKKVS